MLPMPVDRDVLSVLRIGRRKHLDESGLALAGACRHWEWGWKIERRSRGSKAWSSHGLAKSSKPTNHQCIAFRDLYLAQLQIGKLAFLMMRSRNVIEMAAGWGKAFARAHTHTHTHPRTPPIYPPAPSTHIPTHPREAARQYGSTVIFFRVWKGLSDAPRGRNALWRQETAQVESAQQTFRHWWASSTKVSTPWCLGIDDCWPRKRRSHTFGERMQGFTLTLYLPTSTTAWLFSHKGRRTWKEAHLRNAGKLLWHLDGWLCSALGKLSLTWPPPWACCMRALSRSSIHSLM